MKTTICAPVTGSGCAAVMLVRLSGPQACAILPKLLGQNRTFEPRKQTLCTLYDNGEVLDKALVTYFQAPHSFTGEDVVEFALHGSPYIQGRLLELLCRYGAVPARRGEFSYRAFVNGKMDLVQAQGLCDLIASGNASSHRLALRSLDGQLSQKITAIKRTLSELLAQIEVRLDDVDEEMEPLAPGFVRAQLAAPLAHIRALTGTFSVGRLIKDGLKVAIIGVPNNGKSSLLNALVGFNRAIVSAASGTTRDTIEETLEINGQKIILTDTAGIRDHALDPAEEEGIFRSRKAMEKADAILFLLDASREITAQERALWEEVSREQKRILIISNKADKAGAIYPLAQGMENYAHFSISCKTGEGIEKLKNALTAFTRQVPADGLMISNLRHYQALLLAQTELESAVIRQEAGGEIVAEHLRAALSHLRELIGEVTPDDILGIIFSKFCMGK